tara:strand:+ start:1522 stop:2781 length:1260 start_codon:yes stop_codon:yes gene_type:complete
LIKGNATISGTKKFLDKFKNSSSFDFYSKTYDDLSLSSIGIGMYKGENNDEGDVEWKKSLEFAISNGINVFDTAIRYRNQRSEKILGEVLTSLIKQKKISRAEILVFTKGGLLGIPRGYEEKKYIDDIIVQNWGVPKKEISRNIHCMYAPFLKKQLLQSLENLNLSTVDCYFIHNPELAKEIFNNELFYERIYELFSWLESEREKGRIIKYGIASWNGFRRRKSSKSYIDFEKICSIAKEAGGKENGFSYVEAPLNIGMPFIANQYTSKKNINNFFSTAKENNVNIITSASTYEGNIESLMNFINLITLVGKKDSKIEHEPSKITLPISENSLIQMLEVIISQKEKKRTIEKILSNAANCELNLYPSALNIVRSHPGVTSALCGMNLLKFIKENIILRHTKKINPDLIAEFFDSLKLIS